MADLAGLISELGTQIPTLVAGLARTSRSDYLESLDAVPSGGWRFSIRAQYEADRGQSSAVVRKGASVLVPIAHRLASPYAETAVTSGSEWVSLQATLVERAWWRALASVYSVDSGPDLAVDVDRTGDVLSYTVGVELTLA